MSMKAAEMKARFAQVSLVSVKVVFTTKHYGSVKGLSPSDVQKWQRIGAKEVRQFVWPKVVVRGPDGDKSYSLTWMNPHAPPFQTKLSAGAMSEPEKFFVKCALGKAQKLPEGIRGYARQFGQALQNNIESRVMNACRARGLTEKVTSIWRKARRGHASKELQATLEKHFKDLTDYDVKETWKTVKRLHAVRDVMES